MSAAFPPEVRDEAVHGSYCPKMCNFSCPVVAATGREAVTPWGLHVTVAELATGRREPDPSSFDALTGCTGCHACRDACLYDQDVPAQVRAARSAHDPRSHPGVARADDELRAGRSPYGLTTATPDGDTDGADVQVLFGCRDEQRLAEAVVALLRAAGQRVRPVVPEGCCGALASDLGLSATADGLRAGLAGRVDPDLPTVSTDPHCLPVLRALVDGPVADSVTFLDQQVSAGALRLAPAGTGAVTYHDPCLSARDEGTVDAPRRLLHAAGIAVQEARRHGPRTVCSGAGMGMDLLDPATADAVGTRRVEELGDRPLVTACSRARALLAASGADARDVHVVLAEESLGGDRR